MNTNLSLEQELLRKVGLKREYLSRGQSRDLIARITGGHCRETEHIAIAALLCAMHIRGESAEELAGAAAALHDVMQGIDLHSQQDEYYDVVGTGGDGKSTVSVSTATSLALSAMGVAVAKHGNRAVSGKVGSADILAECGLNFAWPAERLQKSFANHGFTFLFAPLYHSSMRFAAPIRTALKFPTIFNFLGPLCNPSLPDGAAVGVNHLLRLPSISGAAQILGKKNYFFYSSEDGYDEISTGAPSHVYAEGQQILAVEPKDFFEPFPIPSVENLEDACCKFCYMLSGAAEQPDAGQQAAGISPELGLQLHRTIALNTAVCLYLFGKAANLQDAFAQADTQLRQGAASRKLTALQQDQQNCQLA